MERTDYRKAGERQIEALGGERPGILLHCCCAPCASSCTEYLKDFFDIHAYFYNPNIPEAEYLRRKSELERFLSETGWADVVPCPHEEGEFYEAARGLEDCPEGGERCRACFSLRLERTAAEAERLGYGYFASTLTLSPLKDAALINSIGEAAGRRHGVTWLYSDFKKRDGYLRSVRLSEKYGLYRQNFCGCVYSERDPGRG